MNLSPSGTTTSSSPSRSGGLVAFGGAPIVSSGASLSGNTGLGSLTCGYRRRGSGLSGSASSSVSASFAFSSIGSQSFGDEADQEDNDEDDDVYSSIVGDRDDEDQGMLFISLWIYIEFFVMCCCCAKI